MSQTETIMLIALGFVAALLVSLLVIRGVWRYAVDLGKRRIERRAPSALAELKADRDRLKAEFAMQGRRLQLRLDDLKTRMAEQMAEASRNRNRIEQLAIEISSRDKRLTERDAEIASLRAQLDSLQRELAERTEFTQQARDDLRHRDDEIAALRERMAVADARLAEQTYMLETVQTVPAAIASASGTGNRAAAVASASVSPEQVEERLRARIAELNALTRQIDEQRRDLSFQQSELTTLREELDRSRQVDLTLEKSQSAAEKVSDAPTISLVEIETAGQKLEQQILDAERETQSLTTELARLDELWKTNLDLPGGHAAPVIEPEAAPAKPARKTPRKGKTTGSGEKEAASNGKPASRKRAAAKQADAGAKPVKQNAGVEKPAGKKAARKQAPSTAKNGGKAAARPEDNVISLAQRIRALQTDLGGKKP
jgi:predicted nuclease with TOPRIM domain